MSQSKIQSSDTHVGRYVLSSKIGAGSYGNVYRAFDPILKREVAVKIPSLTIEKENLEILIFSFYHEAELAARLMHPNIVAVYDVGASEYDESDQGDGQSPYFLVMEYVPGTDLAGYIEQLGKLSLDEAIGILSGCCKALDYIHFKGIIHRDIKPGNIMVNPTYNTVKLMDFSISHDIAHPTNKNVGTLYYMSPEHFDESASLGPSSDLFALGSVMYTMLAGTQAFRAATNEAIMYQICNVEPTLLTDLRDDLPDEINDFMRTALHKDPEKRFPDALAFADALNNLTTASKDKHEDGEAGSDIDQYLLFRHETWFSKFPPNQIAELIDAAQIVVYKDGETIISEGDVGKEVYTVLEGKAHVYKEGQQVGSLESGESFGELGFSITELKRTANVVADGVVYVLKIFPDKLEKASADTKASLYQSFLGVTIKRLQERTDEVAELKAELGAGAQKK